MRVISGLIAAAIALYPSIPAAAQSIEIKNVRVGFPHEPEDRYKVGHWAPVSFVASAPLGIRHAHFVIETEDGDGVRARSVPVPVTFSQEKMAPLPTVCIGYARIGSLDGLVRIDVTGTVNDKPTSASAVYDPYARAPALDPSRTLLVCLGKPAGFDQVPVNDPTDPAWRVAFPDVARLPDQWLGYDAADAVILPTRDDTLLDRLRDEGKLAALERWVQMGGHLVVSISKNAKRIVEDPGFAGLRRMLPAEIDPDAIEPRSLDNLGSFVRTRVRGATDKTFSPALARLRLRPTARSISSESDPLIEGPSVPIAVQVPYGLGSVTLLAFDTDDGPFTAWEGRRDFWVALFKLRADTGQTRRSLAARLRPEDEDLAARLCNRLERFPDVPIVPFLWVSLLMAGYLVLVGPIDYFVLKRVLKRMHFTWITFPIVVVVACTTAFLAAQRVKGNELRINKIDLIEIDWSGRQALGSTWLTVYSPAFQRFDIDLQPAGLGSRFDVGTFSWMGRPGGGTRGLGQSQRVAAIGPGAGDAYEHATAPTGGNVLQLRDLAIGQWAAKTLMARWQMPLEVESNRLDAHLRSRGFNLEGNVAWDLPWTMDNCRLVYRDQAWELGTLRPGDVIVADRLGEAMPTRKLAEREEVGRNPAATRDAFFPMLREMMVHKAATGGRGAPSQYLDYLDQSWRLDFASQAMLIGQIRDTEGSAAEITTTTTLGTRLHLARPGLSGRIRQCTIVRVFLPVSN